MIVYLDWAALFLLFCLKMYQSMNLFDQFSPHTHTLVMNGGSVCKVVEIIVKLISRWHWKHVILFSSDILRSKIRVCVLNLIHTYAVVFIYYIYMI